MIEIADIETAVRGHSLVRGVDQLPTGPIRIETRFLYPDGASVDLFVVNDRTLLHQEDRLSDLAQTLGWLLDVQVKPWLSKKRQGFLEDAIELNGVEQRGGELVLPLEGVESIIDGIVALGQACVRVSDLMFTKRSVMVTSFSEQVEDVLNDAELTYDSNVELSGRFGELVRVDFLVSGRRTKSAVLGLASGTSSQAHVAAVEVFRRFYDLKVPERSEQRVTVLDDSADVYRDEDLRRLRDVSDVVALSDRQSLLDLLAA